MYFLWLNLGKASDVSCIYANTAPVVLEAFSCNTSRGMIGLMFSFEVWIFLLENSGNTDNFYFLKKGGQKES